MTMTAREIHSLMRRLFYAGVSAKDGYRHLIKDEQLDPELVGKLLSDYIATRDVIVYADRHAGAQVPFDAAFASIIEYRLRNAHARVQVVASDFSSRVVIEPIGVGTGEYRQSSA